MPKVEGSWMMQVQDTPKCTRGYTHACDLEVDTEVAQTDVADTEVA